MTCMSWWALRNSHAVPIAFDLRPAKTPRCCYAASEVRFQHVGPPLSTRGSQKSATCSRLLSPACAPVYTVEQLLHLQRGFGPLLRTSTALHSPDLVIVQEAEASCCQRWVCAERAGGGADKIHYPQQLHAGQLTFPTETCADAQYKGKILNLTPALRRAPRRLPLCALPPSFADTGYR
ncbi:unnamed protein product, partial [Ectocarpus sp. 13 AM-2016]